MPVIGKLYWFIFVVLGAVISPAQAQIRVFAAASLAEVMDEIGATFTQETGIKVSVIPAGSSTLAQQIVAGAPADIFVSASRAWVTYVQQKAEYGLGVTLFSNRLVVISPGGSHIELSSLSGLDDVLGNARLAIGDPEHVPAGIYAKEALESAAVWTNVANQLAPTANVRAALRLVVAGAAPLGIVYATDVAGAHVEVVYDIEPWHHQRIAYVASMALDADEDVQHFFTFLQEDISKAIAVEFGYASVGGEQL